MHHSYLDKYARGKSFLHRLDARVKLSLAIICVILIASVPVPGIAFLIFWILIILLLSIIARIPLGYILIRSAIVIPFSGFAAFSYALSVTSGDVFWQFGPFTLTSDGIIRSLQLLTRAWIAVSLMILLVNTTPFDRILHSLRSLKIPPLLILLLSFFYRYLYLFWDEAERMQRARNARYYGGYWGRQLALFNRLVAMLFLRTYERAENVQNAMVARGWDGEVRLHPADPLNSREILYALAGFLILGILWSIRRW